MKNLLLFFSLFLLCSSVAMGKDPDCSGVERWPTKMAFVTLKNDAITDNYKLDFTKTTTVLLASEKIGGDLYRQIHYITFTEKSGKTIEVITINDVSHEECSMSAVDVYVVGKHIEPYPQLPSIKR